MKINAGSATHQTGWVRSNGTFGTSFGTSAVTVGEAPTRTGVFDEDSFVAQRLMASYDLTGVPSGASITGAVLRGRLKCTETIRSPLSMRIEHVRYGSILNAGSFSLAASGPGENAITTPPAEAQLELDVIGWAKSDYAETAKHLQLRLRVNGTEVVKDGWVDICWISDGGGDYPALSITYQR